MSELVLNGHASVSPFDVIRHEDDGGEYWSARELMPLLGYDQWRRFEDAISRARLAAQNVGTDPTRHFAGADNINDLGYRSRDYRLTRYGAYLVAMNGDPRKEEIAKAQTYFAVRTREAELATPAPMPAQRFEIPETYAAALRLAAEQVERAEAAEERVAELEPSALAWDTLASADGDYSVREAAYILNRDPAINTGQRRLFGLLRAMRIIGPRDIPYAAHEEHVRLRPRSYAHPVTGEETPGQPQVRITAEGLRYLHRRLGGASDLNTAALPAYVRGETVPVPTSRGILI